MKFLFTISAAAFLVSCNSNPRSVSVSADSTTARTVFFDKAGMDTTVSPGDNFYNYANGNWVKSAVIPDDQTGWGGFYTLYEDNLKKLKGILEEASRSNAAKGSLEQKTGDYYTAGMDTVAIEAKGATPLNEMLAKIDAVKDYKELMKLVADNNAAGWSDIIGFGVGADEKNSKMNIAVFSQSALSLPEKGYYSKTDSASMAAKAAMVKYATKLFSLTGTDSASAAKQALGILALETEIAKSHRTPVETRDPQKNYNKISVADLNTQQPNINWAGYFLAMNVNADSVNVQQPGYYTALDKLLAARPVETWKSKLKFDYISANAFSLSKNFVDARFEMNRVLFGQKKQSERWKKMVQSADNGLGELLGQLYVKKYFTGKAKTRMDELVKNLQKAFEVRIKRSEWMSDSTKLRAVSKLNAFLQKIGYPSKWKNYDDVTIDRSDYFTSLQSIRKHNK
ncbi:MAG: M13 family metallopeptidase N-terminal domain-containing protein [Ferruginibacter sp.]